MNATTFDTPFKHWVLSQVVPAEMLVAARSVLPPIDSPGWIRYFNPLENNKWTMESRDYLPDGWKTLFDYLETPDFCMSLEHLTGIKGLVAAPDRRGAGLHILFPGGS